MGKAENREQKPRMPGMRATKRRAENKERAEGGNLRPERARWQTENEDEEDGGDGGQSSVIRNRHSAPTGWGESRKQKVESRNGETGRERRWTRRRWRTIQALQRRRS